jgi:O-antigen/teichoic acid export membrane protein
MLVGLLSLPLGLISSVIIARFLSLEDRGYFGVAMTISGLLVVVGNLGWPAAIIYRIKRIGTPPDHVLGTTFWLSGVVTGGLILICLFFRDNITNGFMAGAPDILFYIILALFPLQILGNYLCGIARGMDRFEIQNTYRLSILIGQCVFFALAFLLLSNDLIVAMWAALITFFIGLLILCFRILPISGVDFRLRKETSLPMIRFGFKGWIHALAGNIHERADIIMLSSTYLFGNHSQVALYIQAVLVLNIIKVLPTSICTALLPHIAGIASEKAITVICQVLRFTILLLILVALFVFLIVDWVVPAAFGENYSEAVNIIHILLPALVFQSIYTILAKFWIAIDYQRVNIILQTFAMLVNVTLNFLFIPQFGIYGAAYATVITYILEALAMIAVFKAYTNCSINVMFLIKNDDIETVKSKILGHLKNN